MRLFTFRNEVWLSAPPDEVFPFFADACNLERLTPRSLRFRVLTPRPIEMRVGTRVDYRIQLHGLPMRWQSEITQWDPPHGFVDEQRRGPYRCWIHEHSFAPSDGGTLARDEVRYAAPGGILAQRLFVARDLRKIFAYRNEALRTIFPGSG